MQLIFLFTFLQLTSILGYADTLGEAKQDTTEVAAQEEKPDTKQNDKAVCLEVCHKRVQELPTCRDTACKAERQKILKACKADCEAKNSSPEQKKADDLPPCVVACIDLAKLDQGQCQGAAPCLENVTRQAQECANKCYQEAVAAGQA